MDSRQSYRAPKANQAQWAVLVDFLIQHPEMVTRTFVGLDARENYRNLWEEIATQLNSMGFGSKCTEQWIDAFTKWKSKVRSKAQNIKLGMNRTGGGGPLPPLTPIEEKLIGIIGWTVVEGDATTELGLGNSVASGQYLTPSHNESQLTFTADISSRDCDMTEIEIPPLVPLSFNVTNIYPSHAVPGTSATNIEPLDTAVVVPSTSTMCVESSTFKRMLPNVKKNKMKRKMTPIRTNRKGDEMTLFRMHQETMAVLKDININLGRLADNHEAFLNKSHCTCQSSTQRPSFHDYC